MPNKSGRFAAAIGGILTAAILCIAGSGVVRAEDRLLGMLEPVKAKKPYRIAYSSADMNADFFLAHGFGTLEYLVDVRGRAAEAVPTEQIARRSACK